MKLLIVEDDEFKRQNVAKVVSSIFPSASILSAKSIVSALDELENHDDIHVVILDMSLPTYDVGPEESGGRPQGFGGLTVLQHLEALDRDIPVVVITQFLQFGEGALALDLRGLEDMLVQEHGGSFKCLIHYSSGSDRWKQDLEKILSEIASGVSE